jgi:pantoate--beta-alanine ligase
LQIVRDIKKMQSIATGLRKKGKAIGFVPTMGALHDGHLSLIRQARRENDCVVVSIFINPTQFGPKEDFKKYPRKLKMDILLSKGEGADIIFFPDAAAMYPADYKTYVNVEGLSDCLCGRFRPGHFRGVATVVTKLFNIVQPERAYFGQKDAQQATIIKKMVCDLNIPARIRVLPTVREADGLALSSRNTYLSEAERSQALVLFQALSLARDLIRKGNRNSLSIIPKIRRIIEQKKRARVQYISIVDPQTLQPVEKIKGKALIILAVYFGKTRLIDNIAVNPKHA